MLRFMIMKTIYKMAVENLYLNPLKLKNFTIMINFTGLGIITPVIVLVWKAFYGRTIIM